MEEIGRKVKGLIVERRALLCGLGLEMLDIVQSFPFIFLLYCGTHECVYI